MWKICGIVVLMVGLMIGSYVDINNGISNDINKSNANVIISDVQFFWMLSNDSLTEHKTITHCKAIIKIENWGENGLYTIRIIDKEGNVLGSAENILLEAGGHSVQSIEILNKPEMLAQVYSLQGKKWMKTDEVEVEYPVYPAGNS